MTIIKTILQDEIGIRRIKENYMTMHIVNFTYTEMAAMDIDIDPDLDQSEKELAALAEIKDSYPDVYDLEITTIKEIN